MGTGLAGGVPPILGSVPPADDALARAYADAEYEAHLPGGTVRFRVGAAPAGATAQVEGRRLAILTAYNPGHERPGDAANRAANRRLRAHLRDRGHLAFPARGSSPDRAHQEPSFAVLDVSEDDARAIGRAFRQAAVLYWDGRSARLLWCGEPGLA